ncbi:MAG TPA: CdaR family protein [Bryobacteraceae bacterium]|nr:CdaR family protein [Bryobacteraceae bacterium]
MLWRGLTRNLGWKLASLALAVLLWLAVVGEPELVTLQAVPVLYRNLPRGMLLLSGAPEDVRVELQGPSGRLSHSALSDVFVALDLSDVSGPGERTFTLASGEFSLPQGVVFLRAVPSQLRLNFDRIAFREVPVRIRLNGKPPSGYRVAGQEIAPSVLRVSGPEERIGSLEGAETDPINVQNLTRTTQVKVHAFIADPRVQFESPPVVNVKLTIKATEGNGNR